MSNILVIEDEEDIRTAIKELLESENYNVITDDGNTAILELMENNEVELVILDLMLPKLSGEDILVIIKEVYPKIPVIAVTAKNTVKTENELFNMGINDFIKKPFKKNDLLVRIRGCLKNIEKFESEVIFELSSSAKHTLTQPLCVIKGLADLQLLNLDEYKDVTDLQKKYTEKDLDQLKEDLMRISKLVNQINYNLDIMTRIKKIKKKKISKGFNVPKIEELSTENILKN